MVVTWLLVMICSFARCKSKTVFLWQYISSEVVLPLSCFVLGVPLAYVQVGLKNCYYTFPFPAFLVRCLSLFYVIEPLDRWIQGSGFCKQSFLRLSQISSLIQLSNKVKPSQLNHWKLYMIHFSSAVCLASPVRFFTTNKIMVVELALANLYCTAKCWLW